MNTYPITLRMTFDAGFGDSFTMTMPLDEHVASKFTRIKPPELGPVPGMGHTFEETVEILRTREFRKRLFVLAAGQLGMQLAERMEDAEGWNDVSRVDPAFRSLKGL